MSNRRRLPARAERLLQVRQRSRLSERRLRGDFTPTGQPDNAVMYSVAAREQILAGGVNVGCRSMALAESNVGGEVRYRQSRLHTRYRPFEDVEQVERYTGHAARWPAGVDS